MAAVSSMKENIHEPVTNNSRPSRNAEFALKRLSRVSLR